MTQNVSRKMCDTKFIFLTHVFMRLSQIVFSSKNNIPSSGSDAGAGGHGTVVFVVVTTVPCSGINVIFTT